MSIELGSKMQLEREEVWSLLALLKRKWALVSEAGRDNDQLLL